MTSLNQKCIFNMSRLRDLQGPTRPFDEGKRWSLQICMLMTEHQQHHVSRRHDRVYAMLGMLHDHTRSLLVPLNYDRPVEELYQTATMIMVLDYRSLEYLTRQHVVYTFPGRASWTWFSPFHMQHLFPKLLEHRVQSHCVWSPIVSETGNEIFDENHVVDGFPKSASSQFGNPVTDVNSPILVTKGFILDTVITSFDNLSPGNIRRQLISVYRNLREELEGSFRDATIIMGILNKMWQAFQIKFRADASDHKEDSELFIAAISTWILNAETDAIVNVSRPHQAVGACELVEELLVLRLAYTENDQVAKHFGRNTFISAKGYVGVGPMDDDREGAPPAVQVGDELMMLPLLDIPIVLRAHPDGLYTFIGPAHLPEVRGNHLLQPDGTPNLVDVRIK
ncbi:hypothetical protein VTL71DRAFT_12295 [Oculimacula yallundae]|uniref:Uncharacterized protein n=1 Tax=Oculimacula yallundae TaxID=86028 RepID=A0ABR4CM76_9HELO